MILRGFHYKLQPSAGQEALFRQFAGVCRLIYNLALEQRRHWWRHFERETGSKLNYITQARELTTLRAAYDWIAAVSQTCQQQALRDLDKPLPTSSQDAPATPRHDARVSTTASAFRAGRFRYGG
jgi:putative transposase